MILASCQSISKTYSSRPLFKEIAIAIEDDQRVGLIGPNGAGKSTLLKIIAGIVEPDEGEVVRKRNLRTAYVAQEDTFVSGMTVGEIIRQSAALLECSDHQRDAAIDSTLTKMRFPDLDALSENLSGGWKKRLSLACALVQQPQLLLLDEPTNHLDLQGVLWLEKMLMSISSSFILVSHDRAFLDSVTNRVVELNPTYPQGFLSVNGTYSDFLSAREEQLSAQRNLEQALASQVRREIAWLQRGARARQTKSRHRIKEAGKLIDDLADIKQRNVQSQIEIGFDSTGRKRKELLIAKNLSKSFAATPLFSSLDLVLASGFKLGLVGRNGSGKTTLLRILLGDVEADSGTIKRSEGLRVVWFDQNRQQLDQSKTLAESLSPSSDSVVYRGRPLHVSTWAKKFLFRPDQLHLPIMYLSGGEQSRILIANLMLQPADVLILDEPTNDLDIPSLEVLEDSLVDFPGTVILVTHDRMMLDQVSDQILVLDGAGGARFFASYEQFEDVVEQLVEDTSQDKLSKKSRSASKTRTGLSTAEKRELAGMAERIEELERNLSGLEAETQKPGIASDYPRLQALIKQQETTKATMEELFNRWQELESRAPD